MAGPVREPATATRKHRTAAEPKGLTGRPPALAAARHPRLDALHRRPDDRAARRLLASTQPVPGGEEKKPRSLGESLKADALTDPALAEEIDLISGWLLVNPPGGAEYEQLSSELDRLEGEQWRRTRKAEKKQRRQEQIAKVVEAVEAGRIPAWLPVFPFLPSHGLGALMPWDREFDAAPIMARREGESIVVQQPINSVKNTRRFAKDVRSIERNVRGDVFSNQGGRLRPDDLVGVRLYDEGDKVVVVEARQLLEFARASDRAVYTNIVTTALSAGSGVVAGNVAKSVAARSFATRLAVNTAAGTGLGFATAAGSSAIVDAGYVYSGDISGRQLVSNAWEAGTSGAKYGAAFSAGGTVVGAGVSRLSPNAKIPVPAEGSSSEVGSVVDAPGVGPSRIVSLAKDGQAAVTPEAPSTALTTVPRRAPEPQGGGGPNTSRIRPANIGRRFEPPTEEDFANRPPIAGGPFYSRPPRGSLGSRGGGANRPPRAQPPSPSVTVGTEGPGPRTGFRGHEERARVVTARGSSIEEQAMAERGMHVEEVPPNRTPGRRERVPQAGHVPISERVHVGDLENGLPTGTMGELVPADLHTGSPSSHDVNPVGQQPGGVARYGARKGHLLADVLGGSGRDLGNLAWMHELVNNSSYKRLFENPVINALRSGKNVRFGVRPKFRGREVAPYEVEVWATTSTGRVVVPAGTRVRTPGLSDLSRSPAD